MSTKFWAGLYKLFIHVDFNMQKWKENLVKMCDTIGPRVRQEDYLASFMKVYNWNNRNKIELEELVNH
jgi:hypothetical protein